MDARPARKVEPITASWQRDDGGVKRPLVTFWKAGELNGHRICPGGASGFRESNGHFVERIGAVGRKPLKRSCESAFRILSNAGHAGVLGEDRFFSEGPAVVS